MTIIMLAICPTNVIMGMSLTGYPISGNHGNRHETKMAVRLNWGQAQIETCAPVPDYTRRGRLKTDGRMPFGDMLQIVPVHNWTALAMSYSSSSAWRLLLASYSSRVTTSSMRRLMPATSSPVIAVRRSVTRSFTSSKIAGA